MPYDELAYGHVCASQASKADRATSLFVRGRRRSCTKPSGRYNYDDDRLYARKRTNELYWSNVERRKPETMVLQTANSFLGLRLECAQCHNHPFDRWTKRDFEQFQSIFMTVKFCNPKSGVEERGGGRGYGVETVEPGVSSRYTGVVVKTPPKLLGGDVIDLTKKDADAREQLWQWMRSPDNPYFAPSLVNRLWAHYFGRGIVNPPDDFNQGNPPSHPRLLAWLAKELIDNDYDIKHVHQVILNSRAYQTSWETNDSNRLDRRNFSTRCSDGCRRKS